MVIVCGPRRVPRQGFLLCAQSLVYGWETPLLGATPGFCESASRCTEGLDLKQKEVTER